MANDALTTTSQRALHPFASTFHKTPDAEKGANRPGPYLCDFGMQRRWVSQIALEYLVAMWAGVSIEVIAKLGAATRAFFSKHSSATAREMPSLELRDALHCGEST